MPDLFYCCAHATCQLHLLVHGQVQVLPDELAVQDQAVRVGQALYWVLDGSVRHSKTFLMQGFWP